MNNLAISPRPLRARVIDVHAEAPTKGFWREAREIAVLMLKVTLVCGVGIFVATFVGTAVADHFLISLGMR